MDDSLPQAIGMIRTAFHGEPDQVLALVQAFTAALDRIRELETEVAKLKAATAGDSLDF